MKRRGLMMPHPLHGIVCHRRSIEQCGNRLIMLPKLSDVLQHLIWTMQCFYFRDRGPKCKTTQGTAAGLKSVVVPHFNGLCWTSAPPPKTLITASISSLD